MGFRRRRRDDAGICLASPAQMASLLPAAGGGARISRALIAALATAWTCGVCAGSVALLGFSSAAGVDPSPPVRWPAESRLTRTAGQATLVMLLHPGCAGSRASLEELDRLMVETRGLASVHVLFFTPAGAPPDWGGTDLWRKAAAIPGVQVGRDDGGAEAARFGAATSGQVLLYATGGELRFSGGITPARGHEGDNEGRRAIAALLTATGAARRSRSPVFGCSLRDPERTEVGRAY
jgi:hypothetical protein